MKTTKKFLTLILSLAMTTASALAISSCDTPDNTANTPPSSIEAVYTQYVEYTSSQGQQPLSYEAWLDSIKGKDGVGISRLEYDNDGNLVVYFTDGTTQTIETPSAPEVNTETLQYQKIIGEDEYRVVGIGTVSDNEVVIPATYRGLPVTEIAENAFYYHTGGEGGRPALKITKITIPDSVTSIGERAFYSCTSLKSVVVGKGVKKIGDQAFSRCTSLTSFVIPDSVTVIGSDAFANCENLIDVVISNGVSSIGNEAFSRCTGLTKIIIPDSVDTMGGWVFSGCENLTIYCEKDESPDGWAENWNSSDCTVVWGYTGE